jgi:phosphate transport system substrate-binding protein
MSEKKETATLTLLLLVAAGLIGCGFWWANGWPGLNLFVTWLRNLNTTEEPQKFENFEQVQNVPSGLFNYGGSTTWAAIRNKVDPIIQTTWPEFRLRYTDPVIGNPGSGTGIKMLLRDQLAFSQSSRPLLEDEYRQAKARGFTLKEIPVAIDGIAIAVHPETEIFGLTVDQLKDIYTGKVSNWNQVGGPDLPLMPYSRDPQEGGTVEFFVENVLGGSNFGPNVQLVPNTTAGLRNVASNIGGIYYASASQIVTQCNVKPIPIGREADNLIPPYQEPFVELELCPSQRNSLNKSAFHSGEYPITRRLFVIVKQNAQEDERAGFVYSQLMLTDQGQKLIDEAGFIGIR